MQIVILGAGKTGSYVASALSKEGYDVTLIDRDMKVLEKASRDSDLATVHTTIPDWHLLESLLEEKPDLFFAATGDDQTNLVSCTVAKHLGYPKTVARVKSRDYLAYAHLDFNRLFHADYFLSAEILSAQNLFHLLVGSGHFSHGAVEMRTLGIPEHWDKGGTPLCDLNLPQELIVGLIRRKMVDGEGILIPRGGDHLLPGDEVTFVGKAKQIRQLHEVFRAPEPKINSIVIVGGTEVAEHLAFSLATKKISVRIIDLDAKRCDHLAERLSDATLINRDGSDAEFLRSERVQDADAVVSSTNHDGTNLLIAGLAKEIGCKKAIALISDVHYVPVLEKAGVTPVLSAEIHIANRIHAILQEETILSVSSICQDQAKIVELKVPSSSPLIGIPLSDLKLPDDLLIAVIESRGRVMVGRGDRILSPNDIVVAICSPIRVPEISGYFHAH